MVFKKFLNVWGPVAFWCGLIFIFSSIPTLPKVEIIWWDFILKKSGHVVEYAVLYLLIFRALTESKFKIKNAKFKITPNKFLRNFTGQAIKNSKLENQFIWITPLIFGLLYAVSDEYHQSFVPGRTARVMDVGFDFLGMVLAWLWIKCYSPPRWRLLGSK